jgi:hypothetical protein
MNEVDFKGFTEAARKASEVIERHRTEMMAAVDSLTKVTGRWTVIKKERVGPRWHMQSVDNEENADE